MTGFGPLISGFLLSQFVSYLEHVKFMLCLFFIIRYTNVCNDETHVSNHQEKQSRHVRHFHFHGWPEIGIPAEGKGMIDIIASVQRQQQQSGNHPIIVHCR